MEINNADSLDNDSNYLIEQHIVVQTKEEYRGCEGVTPTKQRKSSIDHRL